MPFHDTEGLGAVHIPHNWEYADAAARTSAVGFTAADVGKLARQIDDNSFWALATVAPTWTLFGGTDPTAIHKEVAGEINALDVKATPSDADKLLIEDNSGGSWLKKAISVVSLFGARLWDVLQFNTAVANPAYAEGKVFYDQTHKALSYYNEQSDMTLNIGRELVLRVYNATGGALTNGQVVYIDGSTGSTPTVDLALCTTYEESRIIGMLTHDVAPASYGYATIYGIVHDVNTAAYSAGDTVYLSSTTPGGLEATAGVEGCFPVRVGVVEISGVAGSIFIYPAAGQYTAETVQAMGWPTFLEVTLGWDDGTRTLSLTPTTGSAYRYYQAGVKYEKSSDSIVLPDVEALYLVYYDGATLSYVSDPTNTQIATFIRTVPFVAFIYWNATDKQAEYTGLETHGIGMSPATHSYLHFTRGAQYISGIGLTNVVADGSGNVDASAQFGVESGTFADEDIPHFSLPIGATTGLPIYYMLGTEANPSLRRFENAGFSVITTGTGRLAYNLLSGGIWSVAEVASKDFALCHVFVNNSFDSTRRTYAIMGQGDYPNIGAAREGANVEISGIQLSGLVGPEQVPIATLIFETQDGYTNAVKARIRTTLEGADYVDWREAALIGGGGAASQAPVYSDADFRIFSNADATKLLALDVAPVTTGALRTIGVPNYDLKLPVSDGQVGQVLVTDGATQLGFIDPVHVLLQEKNLDTPTTGWAVTVPAASAGDTNTPGLNVRLFDDTTIEGVGFSVYVPLGATSMTLRFISRAETAPVGTRTVGVEFYERGMPGAVDAWSPGYQLTDVTLPASEDWVEYTHSAVLPVWGITAGQLHQCELARINPAAGTELIGDWALLAVRVEFA
jgi:hypothetical protein